MTPQPQAMRRFTGRSEESLHVHALVDSLTGGGAELLLADFARVAALERIQLSVGFLFERDGSPAADRLRRAGIEPTHVPIGRLLAPAGLLGMRRHLLAVAPDLVHTHLGYADFVGGLAARSLGVPSVSTVHAAEWAGAPRDRVKHRLFAAARRIAAQRVIMVSDGARRAYLQRWDRPERVVRVYNGVTRDPAPGTGAQVRDELKLGPERLVVGMLSALRAEKRHALAIDAVAALLPRFPNLCLAIAGSGPDAAEIRRRVAPLGDHVRLLGHREDPMAVLDAFDVLVLPSATEAFPTSLLEAMAAAVPIVATSVGGIVEMLSPPEGAVLVPVTAGARELASALEPLLADAGLRRAIGERGRERVHARFSPSLWVRETRAVYDAVLAEPSLRIAWRRRPA
jgi:glycosyltransferase involved in cell wall biosynthesis